MKLFTIQLLFIMISFQVYSQNFYSNNLNINLEHIDSTFIRIEFDSINRKIDSSFLLVRHVDTSENFDKEPIFYHEAKARSALSTLGKDSLLISAVIFSNNIQDTIFEIKYKNRKEKDIVLLPEAFIQDSINGRVEFGWGSIKRELFTDKFYVQINKKKRRSFLGKIIPFVQFPYPKSDADFDNFSNWGKEEIVEKYNGSVKYQIQALIFYYYMNKQYEVLQNSMYLTEEEKTDLKKKKENAVNAWRALIFAISCE